MFPNPADQKVLRDNPTGTANAAHQVSLVHRRCQVDISIQKHQSIATSSVQMEEQLVRMMVQVSMPDVSLE